MNPISVQVIRGSDGLVNSIIVSQRGRRALITYTADGGFEITGSLPQRFSDVLAFQSVYGNTAVDITAQTLGNLNVDIAASTIGNIPIDINAQTIGDIDVNLNAQTAAIHIDTATADNIVIDALTQGAFTERRSTLSNNGVTALWYDRTGNGRTGKFFPRGARGFIDTIDIYCRDAGAGGGTITVYIAPSPGMGYTATADITVAAGSAAAWRSATFQRMWNYDSLFVWWVSSGADIDHAYDAGTPYDDWVSADAGVTWTVSNARGWVRAIYYGETPGDLPISGIVNNIEIPNLAASAGGTAGGGAIAASTTETTTLYGAGRLIYACFYVAADNARDNLEPLVNCDGVEMVNMYNSFKEAYDYRLGASMEGIVFSKWDTTNHYYAVLVTFPFPFKRSIAIGLQNHDGANPHNGWWNYVVERIS